MARTSSRRKSGAYSFSAVPRIQTPRSTFNRGRQHITAFDGGFLIPLLTDEVLPGDTWRVSWATVARLATLLKPIMSNVYIDYHAFFVPYRLVWDNFQKFMGEQDNPDDSTDYLVPTATPAAAGYANNSLQDYMGLVPGVQEEHNQLEPRSYNLIWNEWFRDQNLQDSVTVDRGDGPDDPDDYVLLKRGKRHDYFTSCLPWPQKGDAVLLPLGDQAPLVGNAEIVTDSGGTFPTFRSIASPGVTSPFDVIGSGANESVEFDNSGGGSAGDLEWADPGLRADLTDGAGGGTDPYADLSSATAATINQIRQAFQVQRLYEKDARGGTRYVELLRSHFGVISPDQRLQRPEFLGGGQLRVMINPVANTAGTQLAPDQGELAAFGVAAGGARGFVKSFDEHGTIMILASARTDLGYQYGQHKRWKRQTKLDFYFPSLAHLGEQAVLSREIWNEGVAADDDVFGYQERYAEYRYAPSLVTGVMRSYAPSSTDIWHLFQDWSDRPVLNASFIEEDPPFDRVIATPTEPHFVFDSWVDAAVTRPMPTYSVPGLIDHF
ncbi:major capsid protein [Microviridae sp.]|nr:major capsid protein [Microviridae sp.]